MASFLLARSHRLCKRLACASFASPTLDCFCAPTCSKLWRSDPSWERGLLLSARKPISCSAFVRNLVSSDFQAEIADVCVSGINSEANRESSRDDDEGFARKMDRDADHMQKGINGCKPQEESGTYMIEASTCVSTADLADGAAVQGAARLDMDEGITHIGIADSDNDVANTCQVEHGVADTMPVEHDTCNEGVTRLDDTHAHAAMHVAHMLGIIEYENLTVLQGAINCSEAELFSNLSFLISIGFTDKQLVDTISKHPSLLALDLKKSLSRVMRCLQKVELDASYLKQVLLVLPGLVPLLSRRALQERVKALQELEFSAEEISVLLKQLGCNQLERFLNLPVEKMEPTLRYITDDIGVRTGDATKLICYFPSVLLRDVKEEYASKMTVLKQVFEEVMKAKKLFMQLPELLARKTDMLEEIVLCLKDIFAEDVKKLGDLIEAHPGLLTHRKSGIQQVCKYLQSLGFDSRAIVALIAREPYLVECGTDRLQKHVEFLKAKRMDDNAVRGLLENSTRMFFKSLQKRVAPKIEFLENQGITGESLQKYVKSKPQVCDKSLRKSMNPNLDFLLHLGFDKNSSSLKSALKVTLPHSLKSMQARINYLIGLGIEPADVHKMARDEPSILVISDSSVKKQVDFLVKVVKRPVQDLVKCPTFLLSNINKTIMPRLRVFEWLAFKGHLKKFSFSALVETDEAIFVKKFVAAYPEVLPIYKGSPSPSQS